MPNLPRREFLRILRKAPLIAVDVAIEGGNGVMLSKRRIPPGVGKWHLPGSFLGYNERLVQTVKRCARRETGLKVGKIKFFRLYDGNNRDPRGRVVITLYRCRPIGGRLKSTAEGEVAWFKKLPRNVGFNHRKVLKELGYR